MTPKRPIELVNASIALAEAWDKYDEYIESGDTVGATAICETIDILDARYNTLYQEWQILGGTSDIESIAHPLVDYDHADWLDEQATIASAR